MSTHNAQSQFSERDLAFLLDQVNRSGMLGLSIEPGSIVKEEGAVRFEAAYWGEQSLWTFVAPLDEATVDQVRIKSILRPTAPNEKRSWSAAGMPTGGYQVILWALRPEPYMTLTSEGRNNIPADFKIEPWISSPLATPPRSISWEMLDRVRLRCAARTSLADALSESLADDTALDSTTVKSGPRL